MTIDYDHQSNIHTITGAKAALPYLFLFEKPASLLDIGCGTGTWLKAAFEYGILDIFGVDGVATPTERLLVAPQLFRQQDLTQSWDLGRRFDVAICFEVAEHLDAIHSSNLIRSLTKHSDTVYFSAACPGQLGQHHVNCRWPDYWQRLFNDEGFVCDDTPRWKLWNVDSVEPWYRQNMFRATRSIKMAGKEKRIQSVIHPDMLQWLSNDRMINNYSGKLLGQYRAQIETGSESSIWYLKIPAKALWHKISRKASVT